MKVLSKRKGIACAHFRNGFPSAPCHLLGLPKQPIKPPLRARDGIVRAGKGPTRPETEPLGRGKGPKADADGWLLRGTAYVKPHYRIKREVAIYILHRECGV